MKKSEKITVCNFNPSGSKAFFLIANNLFTFNVTENDFKMENSRQIPLPTPRRIRYFCLNNDLGLLYLIPSIRKQSNENQSNTKKSMEATKTQGKFIDSNSTSNDPNKYPSSVFQWNLYTNQLINEHVFSSGKELRNVLMNSSVIVCVFMLQVRIYHTYNFKKSVQKYETGLNVDGCCTLSSCEGGDILAFPGKTFGTMVVVKRHRKYLHMEEWMNVIHCHETKVVVAKLSANGEFLATCSVKGTIIRIFESKSGAKVHELRRGNTQKRIVDFTFSPKNDYLCALSDTGTLHVFELGTTKKDLKKNKSKIKAIRHLNDYFSSEWAKVKYRGVDNGKYCSFVGEDPSVVSVLTTKGACVVLKFDLKKGGAPISHTIYKVLQNIPNTKLVENVLGDEMLDEELTFVIECEPRDKSTPQMYPNTVELDSHHSEQTIGWLKQIIKSRLVKPAKSPMEGGPEKKNQEELAKNLFLFINRLQIVNDREELLPLIRKHGVKNILQVQYDMEFDPSQGYCAVYWYKMPFRLSRQAGVMINSEKSLLFGGLCFGSKQAKYDTKNTLYEANHDLESDEMKIKEINLGLYGTKTPTLYSHCCVFDSEYLNIYVFGGTVDTKFSDTLFMYSIIKKNWEKVETSGGPEKRIDSSLVFRGAERKLVVWGGFVGSMRNGEYCNLLYEFDIDSKKWIEIKCGKKPIGRAQHCMELYCNETKIMIHGGFHDMNPCLDTWSFDFKNGEWKRISIEISHVPIACGIFCDKYLVSIDENIRNVHLLDIEKRMWKMGEVDIVVKSKERNDLNGAPASLNKCSYVVDEKNLCIYIFGGETKERSSVDDCFAFKLVNVFRERL